MGSIFTQSGDLILIGGAEDRKGKKGILRHLVDQVQPKDIIIIPTASSYPQDIGRSYTDAFRDLGIDEIQTLDIRYPDEADLDHHLAALEKADLIFFGGGDQVKLVDTLKRTVFFERLRARFETGDLHIAGTSAGAAAAGNPILYNGDRKGFKKGSIKTAEGFGFIDNVAIDTHFLARRRLSRLCQFLVSGPYKKGIGLDEDTAIVVFPNLHFKVIGSGMVTVVNSAHVTGSNYAESARGDTLRFNNMRVGFLPAGTVFSIRKWSIIKRVGHIRKSGLPGIRVA